MIIGTLKVIVQIGPDVNTKIYYKAQQQQSLGNFDNKEYQSTKS